MTAEDVRSETKQINESDCLLAKIDYNITVVTFSGICERLECTVFYSDVADTTVIYHEEKFDVLIPDVNEPPSRETGADGEAKQIRHRPESGMGTMELYNIND